MLRKRVEKNVHGVGTEKNDPNNDPKKKIPCQQ